MRLQRLQSIVPTSTRYHDNLNIELFVSLSFGITVYCVKNGSTEPKEGFQIYDCTLFADVITYNFKRTIFISYCQEEKIKKRETAF